MRIPKELLERVQMYGGNSQMLQQFYSQGSGSGGGGSAGRSGPAEENDPSYEEDLQRDEPTQAKSRIQEKIANRTAKPADPASKNTSLSLQEVVVQIFETIDDIRDEISEIMTPPGTKASPARTCKDIWLAHKNSTDGWYWVDPNLGVGLDGFQVWCNMTAEGETCVYPRRSSRVVIPKHFPKDKENPDVWFSDMYGGFKIKYPSETQLAFLRLLSNRAAQKLTYFCTNSVAWFNQDDANYRHSIKMMGSNDHVIKRFKDKDVSYDGCKNRRSNAYTIFELRTRKVHQLPVVDILPRDYGQLWQKFGFEVGPVCFSH